MFNSKLKVVLLIGLTLIVANVAVACAPAAPSAKDVAKELATIQAAAPQTGNNAATQTTGNTNTASTALPAPTTARTQTSGGAETFTYIPGGPNYVYPEPGAVEDKGDGWTRIRRNANGQYNAWTFLTRIRADRVIGEKLQWDSSTKLEVFGPIRVRIEIKRDLNWAEDLRREHPGQPLPGDPYDVANAKNSPLGLGWFVTGVGRIVVNGAAPVDLSGPGVKQFGFPRDWRGTWVIDLEVPANGLVVFNQGEKLTPNDNWPLP